MESGLRVLLQSRIFVFGDYASHAYGWLRFDDNSLVSASYPHPREALYHLGGSTLDFLCADGKSVTARLQLVHRQPLLFHGSTLGLSNLLYLREVLALGHSDLQPLGSPLRPPVLVNSVPKSGTYFLQRAFQELGFRPSDLHLGNSCLHDNRGLARDVGIHRAPWDHEVPLDVSLLPPLLAPGSVTVAHIDDPGVLQAFIDANIVVIHLVRDLRSILWSLFRFKLAAVEPRDDADRHWRSCSSPLEQFMGFLAYCWSRDIQHISNCCRTFASLRDVPLLRYEDLLTGDLPETTLQRLEERLHGSGGAPALLGALSAARDAPTPTLTQALPRLPRLSDDEEAEIRGLIHALVAGSGLAEVNAFFGYR